MWSKYRAPQKGAFLVIEATCKQCYTRGGDRTEDVHFQHSPPTTYITDGIIMGSRPVAGFVTIHALDAGWFSMPERFFVSPLTDLRSKKQVPSLSFLIQHRDPDSLVTTKIVFDLGLRRDIRGYCEPIRNHVATREPIDSMPDVVASLKKGGLTPDDVDLVLLSHLHWDHIGTPSDFSTSQFVVGSGALALLQSPQSNSSHNHFEPDLLPLDRSIELNHPECSSFMRYATSGKPTTWTSRLLGQPWQPKGPFPHALDVFGDDSLYIVWSPGHLAGHINLLCRKEDSSFVYLAGDAGHDTRLLSGVKDIAVWHDHNNQTCCIHQNIGMAQKTLALIRQAWTNKSTLGAVEVILAHDADWALAGKASGRFFPGEV